MVAKVELEKSRANDWNDHFEDSLKTKAQVPKHEPQPEQRWRGPKL
jgi:hypothetical protein